MGKYSLQQPIYLYTGVWIRILIHLGLWIRIQRYKIKGEKAEFNQRKSFFSQEIIFFKSEPKDIIADILLMRAKLYCLGSDLKIKSFFLLIKYVLKSIWWFYWPGSEYNQSGSTSLPIYLYFLFNFFFYKFFHFFSNFVQFFFTILFCFFT